jgi:uncharacterized protein
LALRIGLISDTHGLLRPEALACLAGADHIIHGGDIGGPDILDRLREIAPLTVVRGNNDTAAWARDIPETALVRFEDVDVLVIHDLKALRLDGATRPHAVVSGHSHKPVQAERDGILYVNPGSAGRCRFSLPIAVGELLVDGASVQARIITL